MWMSVQLWMRRISLKQISRVVALYIRWRRASRWIHTKIYGWPWSQRQTYGVVGSGDTFYDEFCKAVDDFDRCFAATGAEKVLSVSSWFVCEDEDIEKLRSLCRKELVAKAKLTRGWIDGCSLDLYQNKGDTRLDQIRKDIDQIDQSL